MDLDNLTQKTIAFAKEQVPKPSEYLKHNIRIAFTLVLLLVIHFLSSFVVLYTPWYLTVPLIILNTFAIYYYIIIIIHEGMHELVFYSKKYQSTIQRILPALANIALFPFYSIYYYDHKTHHAFVSEKKDLQNSSQTSFRHLPIFYFRKKNVAFKQYYQLFIEQTNLPLYTLTLTVKIIHLAILYSLGGVYLLLVGIILPVILAASLNALRNSVEHFSISHNPKPLRSRSYTFATSLLLGPGGLRLHFEHHIFPTLPSYKLQLVYDYVEKIAPPTILSTIHYKKFKWRDFW